MIDNLKLKFYYIDVVSGCNVDFENGMRYYGVY